MTLTPDWLGLEIPDVVMDDAAAWLAILDSERCNVSDRAAFAQWLDEDPSHRWAFEELSEVWAKLRTLKDVEPLMRQANVVQHPNAVPTKRTQQASHPGSVSSDYSTLAVIVLLALGTFVHFVQAPTPETFVTGAGESLAVTLDDGSLLELNSRTTLSASLDEQKRLVEMSAGEAVFHVAESERPFIVDTPYGDVAALGTRFAIEISDGKLEVAVIEGKVSVVSVVADVPLIDIDEGSGYQFSRKASVLEQGEWLEVNASHHHQEYLGDTQLQQRLSWRNGTVVFDKQPLQTVIEEMRRYTALPIHIADSELRDTRVSGQFQTSDVTQFLVQLQQDHLLQVDDSDSGMILLRLP